MQLTLYVDADRWVQRLHPTIKLVGMVWLFATLFAADRLLPVVAQLGFIFGLLVAAKALANLYRMRLLLGMVFGMTFVIWSFFYPDGEPVWTFGPLSVSAEGLAYAALVATQLAALLMVGVLFLSVTKIEEFAYALHRVGLPYKLAFTITLTFRLVPVFLDSATSVVQAQRCRGFDFEQGGLLHRLRLYVPILVPVFIGALRRADGMAVALEARGFQHPGKRTSSTPYPFATNDTAAIAVLVAIAAAAWWL